MVRIEKITDPRQLLKFEKPWDDIYNSNPMEVSVSFEWTYSLVTTHLQKNDSLILLLVLDKDAIAGILPLVVSEQKKFGQTLTTLFPVSEYYNTHSDFLLRKVNGDLLEEIMESLFQLEQKWDVFRVGSFLSSRKIVNDLVATLKKTSCKYEIKQEEPSFFIHLGDDYEKYLNKRSSKFRNHLRRMEKKLSRQGTVSFSSQNDCENVSIAYAHLLEIESNSWKHNHGTAISSIPKQEKFYKKLIEGTYNKEYLHLLFLWLDNRPIAYNLGLIKNNTYFYLKTSFSETYRKLSPATVLRAKLIQLLIENGITYFDFPGEPYEWETQWAENVRWHKSLIVYNNNFKADLFRAYQRMRQKIFRSGSEKEIQYHDPRALKSA